MSVRRSWIPRGTLLPALLAAYLFALIGLDLLSMRSGRSAGALINGDGKGYYAWLRSIAIDHDIDFRNDFALIYPPEALPPPAPDTPRGLVPDQYPIGLAVVETPGFLVGHAAAKSLGFPANGVSGPYQLAVVIWLQLLCVASFAALWIALVRLGADRRVATLVIASALLATNLVQYIARPAWAHGPGVALLNFAFFLMVSARGALDENRRMLGAGALLGLALIVRPSNAAIAPFFLLVLTDLFERWRSHVGRLTAGALPMFAIHFGSMWLLWGSLRATGYVGQGFTSGWTGVVGTLFTRHGLFIYHPWYLLMLAIAVFAVRSHATRRAAIGTLLSFAAFTAINGTWCCTWWFGDSFGNRSFIEMIPALVVTGALYLSGLPATRRAFATTVAVLAAVNLMLWTGYVLRRFPPDGNHSVADAYLWMAK